MKGPEDTKMVEGMQDPLAGTAYVIHARNDGVGVAVIEDGQVGYMLHRMKFD